MSKKYSERIKHAERGDLINITDVMFALQDIIKRLEKLEGEQKQEFEKKLNSYFEKTPIDDLDL